MKIKFYTQLMLLVGIVMAAMPVSAHQVGHHHVHGAMSNNEGVWHSLMHELESCLSLFSSEYLLFLAFLIAILGFIVYKVKLSGRIITV